MGEATKGIVQVARKAANLYEHQQAIEDQVRERCGLPSSISQSVSYFYSSPRALVRCLPPSRGQQPTQEPRE